MTLRSHRLWGCMGLWFLVFQNILHWMDTAGPTQPISVPGQPLLQHRKPWVVFDQMPAKLEASLWPGAAPCFPASRMEDRDVSQPGTRALTWIPLPALGLLSWRGHACLAEGSTSLVPGQPWGRCPHPGHQISILHYLMHIELMHLNPLFLSPKAVMRFCLFCPFLLFSSLFFQNKSSV